MSVERDDCDAVVADGDAAVVADVVDACRETSVAEARDRPTTFDRDHSATLTATPADCDEFCDDRSS